MNRYLLATITLTAIVFIALLFAVASLQQHTQAIELHLHDTDVIHQQGINNLHDFILNPTL